jgi:hypothetical protein
LLANFAVHLLAMMSMALILAPMLPGGGTSDDAVRIAKIATHPFLFRLGWVPWHLCALVDIVFAIALIGDRSIPRLPAWATLAVTLLAVIPDQAAQFLWDTRGVALAQEAVSRGDVSEYLAYERVIFFYGSGVAPCLYTVGALGWTWCFFAQGTWSRRFAWMSAITWLVFIAISVAPVLPDAIRPSSAAIAGGNALGFILLEVWLGWATELYFSRARPVTPHWAHAAWRHPWGGVTGSLIDAVSNSRALRGVGEFLPTMGFSSDITDVIYVNYVVDADKLTPLVPRGLELHRLGPNGKYGVLSFLTYRHGHFGPTILGALRRLFPSPIHTNFRVHVVDPKTGIRGITFFTNAIESLLLSLGARMNTEGMPMHVFAKATHARDERGDVRIELDPGNGSAPDAEMTLSPGPEPTLQGPFSECFADFHAMLEYIVPQDRAMATQPWGDTVTRQEIHLGIPFDACEPLTGSVTSRALTPFVGDSTPICFRVAKVTFRFEGEHHDGPKRGSV